MAKETEEKAKKIKPVKTAASKTRKAESAKAPPAAKNTAGKVTAVKSKTPAVKTAAGKVKAQKKIPAKKLPSIYRKNYTEKDFEKKLSKKLYIAKDRELVRSIFILSKDKKGREILCVRKDSELTKSDFMKLKGLAKQIKMQKGGIKLVPLLAVIVLITAAGLCFTAFKNIILEKSITAAMQGIFQAKTDIGSVDFQFFGASLEIKDLQQANKDSPMKNIFQIDDIKVGFNLTELLRGKFYAENLVVAGVMLDTDRKTSGELALKKKTDSEKKAESQIDGKKTSLTDEASKQLKAMFENYNPETMISGLQNELKSPAVAERVAEDIQKKVTKWQAVPAELQTSVNAFSESINSVTKTNWGGINDLAKLKSALETVNNAAEESKRLKTTIEKTAADMKTDSAAVKNYSDEIQSAIKADTSLIDNKLKEIQTAFSPAGFKTIMNNAVQAMLYNVLGQYYPYVNKAMNAASSVKAGSSGSKSETTEKKASEKNKNTTGKRRMPGRTVYYRKNTVPKFLIQNAVASGYEYGTENLLFKGVASEISSDQDIRGKPAEVSADFRINGHANRADVVVDARSSSSAPLITASYAGSGYPVAADVEVFKLKSSSDINAKMTAKSDGSFSIGGSLDMQVSEMTGMDFEPAKVCELYKNALSGIKRLSIGFTAGYDADGELSVAIDNPDKLAAQLVTPVVNAMQKELTSIAADAKTKIMASLSEKTGSATDNLAQFADIQNAVTAQQNKLNSLNSQLESNKAEINKKIEEMTKQAAGNALKNLLKK